MFIEAGGFLDERDGGVTGFGGSSLLGREPTAGAAAPTAWTSGLRSVRDQEPPAASRADPLEGH